MSTNCNNNFFENNDNNIDDIIINNIDNDINNNYKMCELCKKLDKETEMIEEYKDVWCHKTMLCIIINN